eukprot:6179461-Pleurochrysis_carterae.AAC.4
MGGGGTLARAVLRTGRAGPRISIVHAFIASADLRRPNLPPCPGAASLVTCLWRQNRQVRSSTSASGLLTVCVLDIDIQKNEPRVVLHERVPNPTGAFARQHQKVLPLLFNLPPPDPASYPF